MNIEKIKPCWCKSNKKRFHESDRNPRCYAFSANQWHVKCYMCGATGPVAGSREKAIELWNNCPEPTFGLECLLWRMSLEVPELRADSVPSVKALEIINEHIHDLLDQKEDTIRREYDDNDWSKSGDDSDNMSIEKQAKNLYDSGCRAVELSDGSDDYYLYDPNTFRIEHYGSIQEDRDVWNALWHLQETTA